MTTLKCGYIIKGAPFSQGDIVQYRSTVDPLVVHIIICKKNLHWQLK